MRIEIVTFNEAEYWAVQRLLDEIGAAGSSAWGRSGPDAIARTYGATEWRITHVPLRGQGNVVAGAQLAQHYETSNRPDYVVFYGCAGCVNRDDLESVFLVHTAKYLSLGTVERATALSERVTLKNKWLCHVEPPEPHVDPIEPVRFPLCDGSGSLNIPYLTGIDTARVACTDKVLRITPRPSPAPVRNAPPSDRYVKAEWTYAEALGLMADTPGTVIVEMESFGIGSIARAMNFVSNVLVLRITTDSLDDHAGSDDAQRALLMRGRHVLGRVITTLFDGGSQM
jgi:nucleoside phosphorylase